MALDGTTTTVRVIVRGEHKKRRKGQQTLFNAEGVKVTRTYNSDGKLIGYEAVPLSNFDRTT
jgi:hypothetical protein